MKKNYILVFTFLLLLCGQKSFGQMFGGELNDVVIIKDFHDNDDDNDDDSGDCNDPSSFSYPCVEDSGDSGDSGDPCDSASSAFDIEVCYGIPDPDTPEPIEVDDPCADAKNNDLKLNNSKVNDQITSIRQQSTSSEYGAEQNLSVFPPESTPNYMDIPARTDGNSSAFTPNFTWNATDGYTIGVSHGHPANGAPSPADIVNAYGNLSNVELIAAGQEAIDYYKNNFTITTVTQNEIYTVTVSDWDALGQLYNAFIANSTVANDAWRNEALNYLSNNPNCSYADMTTYAGLILYGNAVTITKKENNSTQSTPMNIDSNDQVAKTPCP